MKNLVSLIAAAISSESVWLLEELSIDIREKNAPVYETAAELTEPVIDISENDIFKEGK